MKRTSIILIGLLGLILASCNANSPKPCFELNCESLKQLDCILAGEEVLISNCTDNALSYLWDFGDGTSSTLSSPRHAWEKPGTYTLSLTAENENTSKLITQEIHVENSLYGSWEGEYREGDEVISFTFNLEQAANKIKGTFWTAGPFAQYGGIIGAPHGVLSSNSVVNQDSVILNGALLYTLSFGGTSESFSWMYKFEGVVNAAKNQMSGDNLVVNGSDMGAWEASKKED